MVTVLIGYCALPLPIKRTQSVGVNHLLLGIAITVHRIITKYNLRKNFKKGFKYVKNI